jgi:hypothetical protein
MIKWVHVEDGKIESYHDVLPSNWGHVSGLNLSEGNLKFLKSIGWLPVVTAEPSYDPEIQYIKEYKYKIRASDVVATAVLADKPPISSEVNPVYVPDDFAAQLKNERQTRLLESDWTQLADIQQEKDEEWKAKWSVYRQALRDLPDTYKVPVPWLDIVWPIPPNYEP